MVQILVLLEVNNKNSFREFEMQAIKIMKKYGGKLMGAFEPDIFLSSDGKVGEIHYLEFPSLEAFNNYRKDSELAEITELRSDAITNTSIYVSEKLVSYD